MDIVVTVAVKDVDHLAGNVLKNHIKRALYSLDAGDDFAWETKVDGVVVDHGSRREMMGLPT